MTSIGQLVAWWLRDRFLPDHIYDLRIVEELAAIGIGYDAASGLLWLATGELASLPSYTPAELLRHPVYKTHTVTDNGGRLVLPHETARALHTLLWPTEMPPDDPYSSLEEQLKALTQSIEQRDGMPYRDKPPNGWWRKR
jgi:hypothetical protein